MPTEKSRGKRENEGNSPVELELKEEQEKGKMFEKEKKEKCLNW